MTVPEVYEDVTKRDEGALATLRKDLNGVRTGRASVALLEGVLVESYGVPTPLHQVATLAVPESRLITIQPWDLRMLREIDKAIRKADLGLNPVSDGKILRVPVPPLTEERRRELVKVVKKMAEEAKVALRNVRRDGMERLRKLEKEKTISEDETRRAHDEIQRITDEFITRVDVLRQKKEADVLEV